MNFGAQKFDFLKKIATVITRHGITDNMIINIDQTRLKLIPVSTYTMEQSGVRQVGLHWQIIV